MNANQVVTVDPIQVALAKIHEAVHAMLSDVSGEPCKDCGQIHQAQEDIEGRLLLVDDQGNPFGSVEVDEFPANFVAEQMNTLFDNADIGARLFASIHVFEALAYKGDKAKSKEEADANAQAFAKRMREATGEDEIEAILSEMGDKIRVIQAVIKTRAATYIVAWEKLANFQGLGEELINTTKADGDAKLIDSNSPLFDRAAATEVAHTLH